MLLNCMRKFWIGVSVRWYMLIKVWFMPWRRTVDVAFALRKLTEKFRAKNKKLFFVFVDLEKAFEVICFALRQKGIPEYLVDGVMSLYKGCKTAVSVDRELSKVHFLCGSWCSSKVCFESTFIYHGNGCSGRRCEGWFINGLVVCRRSSFVRGIIK